MVAVLAAGQAPVIVVVTAVAMANPAHTPRALPDKARAGIGFNLGPLALQYILDCGGSGYFRSRVVQSYLERGILERVPKAPEFSYPTYLVYSRERDSQPLLQAFAVLREVVRHDHDWSQRWDPLI